MALLLLLVSARGALATPLAGISFDEATSETAPDTDSFIFTESSSADAAISLSTTVAHDNGNGGSSSSRRSLKVNVTSGQTAAYALLPAFIPAGLTGGCFSVAIHIPTGGNVTRAKPAACWSESSTTDLGCCLVHEPGRVFSLAYMNSNEGACTNSNDAECDADEKCYGTVCRKVWATTAEVTQPTKCSSDFNVPCTDPMDCPGTNPSCGGTYMPVVEICQQKIATTQVRCEAYLKGRAISTGTTKTLDAAASVDNLGVPVLGALNVGDTASAGTYYLDSLVPDDSTLRAGNNYVAATKPSGMGDCADPVLGANCSKGWVPDTCARGSDVRHCTNDYDVGSFVYDTGSDTQNVARAFRKFKVGDFPVFGPPWLVRSGETVTAIDVFSFGRRGPTGAAMELRTSVLACPAGVTGACAVKTNPAVLDMLALTADPQFLQHYLTTVSPIAGSSSWQASYPDVGIRLSSENTGSRNIYVGALLANTIVRKVDTREPATLAEGNKGPDDNSLTLCLLGDSTLRGEAQRMCVGGERAGLPCSQDSYCSWASDSQDHPAGGCLSFADPDAECERCSGDKTIPCATGGDSDCDLGAACNGGFCSVDTDYPCATPADCQRGPCLDDADSSCVTSCPPHPVTGETGRCPTDRAGWSIPIVEKINAPTILSFAMGAEDSRQLFENRFEDILEGRGTQTGSLCLPGVPNSSCGQAIVGAGVCECTPGTVAADCGPTGSCTDGHCTGASDLTKLACRSALNCNFGTGRACDFPNCDHLWIKIGLNDNFPYNYQETRSPLYSAHDPECRTIASMRSYGSFQPVKHCPGYGTGTYLRAGTPCGRDAKCSSDVAPDSTCLGYCQNVVGGGCLEDLDCPGGTCSVNAPLCDVDAQCTLGRSCVGGHPLTPGMLLDGRCGCDNDGECPTGFVCVGDVGGPKFCRRTCTSDGQCTPNVCDTTSCATTGRCDSTSTQFCTGLCVNTCASIPCTTDQGCGGTPLTTRHSSNVLRPAGKLGPGKCNNPTGGTLAGHCGCCGISRCGESASLMRRGCSCTVATQATDCPGGTCGPLGECVGGSKADCQNDRECAPGRRCMRCGEQLWQYQQTHYDLLPDVVARMQNRIDRLPETDGRPRLMVSDIALPGGLLNDGTRLEDFGCLSRTVGQAWPDRFYYASITERLKAILPAHRLVSQATFNALRMRENFRVDAVHDNDPGGTMIGSAFVYQGERQNVCMTGADPQRYCRNLNGTWGSTCNTGADCTSAQTCDRRRCDGDPAQCPGSTCGPS